MFTVTVAFADGREPLALSFVNATQAKNSASFWLTEPAVSRVEYRDPSAPLPLDEDAILTLVDKAITQELRITINVYRNDADTGTEVCANLWYCGDVISESKSPVPVD